MRLGVRGRLFLLSFGLISFSLVIGGIYLEISLRTQLEAGIDAELTRHARAGCAMLQTAPGPPTSAAIDPLADRLGLASSARITVIGPDGVVLGDSELSPAQVRRVENHGRRPEVLQATRDRPGAARRFSTTLDTEMLYLAVRCPRPAGLVVRAARGLEEVDAAVRSLRLFLLVAAALALGAATLISLLASHLTARTLQRLVARARDLAEGRAGQIRIARQDELGGLIGSLNRLAESLQHEMASLASERDRFAAVLQGMADGVLALDVDRRITHANQTALDLLDLDSSPDGRPLVEAIRVPALHEMMAAVRPGYSTTAEFDLAGPGPKRRLRASATRRTEQGGTVIVFQDVTDLRRLETVRQDFVANASHELRTPVSVIRANAETLLAGAADDPDRAREFLEALHRNAERLSALIDDLLDISRLDSDRLAPEIETVGVAALVSAVFEGLKAAADASSHTLVDEVAAEVLVQADAEALKQILTNLADNAIKYTPAGGRVTVRARPDGDLVRLEVTDDGPGIEPRHRERIFERFYRVDKGRSREMGGTGLGLSIVKNLVDAMGGMVGLDPNTPTGCIFWISLPAAPDTADSTDD